ncbi:MAG TPA: arginine--tRNA ligase [Nitrospiria bacterium]|nr:arginine--tRNA ligase [Nitrospiria bacterium]
MNKDLVDLLHAAIRAARTDGQLSGQTEPPLLLEVPRRSGQGDFASTVAMTLAAEERRTGRDIAEVLKRHMPDEPWLERVDVAGPGYLNFTMAPSYWHRLLAGILEQASAYGRSAIGAGRRVQVEFVSANPTGPLHVGHGRIAAVGDTVARLLEATGHTVEREYYINDLGKQMTTLGQSLLARYRQHFGREASIPEGGYQGDYLRALAAEMAENEGPRWLDEPEEEAQRHCSQVAAQRLLASIRDDLDRFGVGFDEWMSEMTLHLDGKVERALKLLDAAGHLYEEEGATWVRTTDFGDDKNRVVVRQNGQMTYFASDLAYHLDKFERGFDEIVDVWGADHHGYAPRVWAGMEALGRPRDRLKIVLVQLVALLRHGKPVSMSTRAGEFVTLREVLDEVGRDAARFFFLMRRCDNALDFDLELAKSQSEENPVYYVQYAHARLCSMQRQAADRGLSVPAVADVDPTPLTLSEEQGLLRQLSLYPAVIESSAQLLEPHRVIFYLQEVAGLLHAYYNKHRVITDDRARSLARLALMQAVRTVLANGLTVVGVIAPERM